jgi:hypothetical protein
MIRRMRPRVSRPRGHVVVGGQPVGIAHAKLLGRSPAIRPHQTLKDFLDLSSSCRCRQHAGRRLRPAVARPVRHMRWHSAAIASRHELPLGPDRVRGDYSRRWPMTPSPRRCPGAQHGSPRSAIGANASSKSRGPWSAALRAMRRPSESYRDVAKEPIYVRRPFEGSLPSSAL